MLFINITIPVTAPIVDSKQGAAVTQLVVGKLPCGTHVTLELDELMLEPVIWPFTCTVTWKMYDPGGMSRKPVPTIWPGVSGTIKETGGPVCAKALVWMANQTTAAAAARLMAAPG